MKKVVLAYSGGLDTSVILKWIKETYQCEVATFTADLGQDENFDAVFGSRFVNGSKIVNYPKKKLILNRIFNLVTKILFFSDYNDFTNAFKIYKKSSLLRTFPLVSESFNIFLELPLKIISRKMRYKIIPISWTNRKAHFRCTLALSNPYGTDITVANGVCQGLITMSDRGTKGFGYDPIFYVPHQSCTMAEMDADTKNRVGHRGKATHKMKGKISKLIS